MKNNLFLPLISILLIIFGVGILFSQSVPVDNRSSAKKIGLDEKIEGDTFSPEFDTPVSSDKSTDNSNETEKNVGGLVLVTKVIDGDTIEIEGGIRIRYIGIDTPETVDPRTTVQCFGREASEKNKSLVEGKKVRLEKDISETDKYSRLLRYIWLGDKLVNEILVKEGYAYSSPYPPDIKYQDQFDEAQEFARENKKGLWSACNSVAGSTTSQYQTSPSGQCLIKGNISSSGEKIYHVPSQRYYNSTVIDESKGERWFCSEKEAQVAGWRKSKI